jgi:hypothetical protein
MDQTISAPPNRRSSGTLRQQASLAGCAPLKLDGGAQTETTVELAPGSHTLQLLLGDMNHIPHNPPILSEKITITVK